VLTALEVQKGATTSLPCLLAAFPPTIAPTTLVGAYDWTSWVCVRVGVGPCTGPFGALHTQKALKRNICIVLKVVPSPCTKRARDRSTS